MNDWNIQSRARSCQGCGRAFADREAYHTLLFEQRSGFERQDVCSVCWDAQHRHGAMDRKGFISHWQGQFLVAPPPPPDPIQKDNAESLLRRLLERNDPAWQPAAYILAVMLERKRVLRVRQQFRSGGRRTFVYEIPRSGDLFTIPDPELQLDQLERVQHDVAHLLEHGLPPDSSPVEEPFVPDHSNLPSLAGPDASAAAPEGETSESPSASASPSDAVTVTATATATPPAPASPIPAEAPLPA